MSEIARFFGGTETDPRPYSQVDHAEFYSGVISDGVVFGKLQRFAVVPDSPHGMRVRVSPGWAYVQGYQLVSPDVKTLTIGAADASNKRIDSVIIRLDTTLTRWISIAVLAGTPSAEPVPPTLTRTTETFDLRLANIIIPPAATVIGSWNIDQSPTEDPDQCGWAGPADIDSRRIRVLDDFDLGGKRLTNIAPAIAANDAVTREFIEAALNDASQIMPTCAVIPFAGAEAPIGWLLCDGSEYYKSEYPILSEMLGERFGVPSNAQFFKVPDLRHSVPIGYDSAIVETDTIGKGVGETMRATPVVASPYNVFPGVVMQYIIKT